MVAGPASLALPCLPTDVFCAVSNRPLRPALPRALERLRAAGTDWRPQRAQGSQGVRHPQKHRLPLAAPVHCIQEAVGRTMQHAIGT